MLWRSASPQAVFSPADFPVAAGAWPVTGTAARCRSRNTARITVSAPMTSRDRLLISIENWSKFSSSPLFCQEHAPLPTLSEVGEEWCQREGTENRRKKNRARHKRRGDVELERKNGRDDSDRHRGEDDTGLPRTPRHPKQ